MALKPGNYTITPKTGKILVYTFKEGFLSAVAHDLLIDVTNFTVKLTVPVSGSPFVEAEVQSNSLKVICAMKDGQHLPEALKDKDKADIEDAIVKDVLHPAKYPLILFLSKNIQAVGDVYYAKGELTLHGVTRPVEFDFRITNGADLKGRVVLPQKDYGIKPYKALLGTLKVKNEVDVGFELSLSQVVV
ncbi:MAG: YceI family protein [Candidatus Brocadiaceae bacterium]